MKEKAGLPSDLPNRFMLEINFPKTNVDRKLKMGARPAVSGGRGWLWCVLDRVWRGRMNFGDW